MSDDSQLPDQDDSPPPDTVASQDRFHDSAPPSLLMKGEQIPPHTLNRVAQLHAHGKPLEMISRSTGLTRDRLAKLFRKPTKKFQLALDEAQYRLENIDLELRMALGTQEMQDQIVDRYQKTIGNDNEPRLAWEAALELSSMLGVHVPSKAPAQTLVATQVNTTDTKATEAMTGALNSISKTVESLTAMRSSLAPVSESPHVRTNTSTTILDVEDATVVDGPQEPDGSPGDQTVQ